MMNDRDIKVLKKVYENVGDYDWYVSTPGDKYSSIIDYPVEANKSGNVYFAEVKKGLIIATGIYQVRFYYEEDNYEWEKRYFASIISNLEKSKPSSIAFITDLQYEKRITEKSFLRIGSRNLDLKSGVKQEPNIIIELYDDVNRQASGINTLYDDFLTEE